MENNWNYDEFLCFILLYAANVNEQFTDEEKSCIVGNVGNDTYDKMYEIFDKMSDFEALEKIMACKGIHYPTTDRRQEVFDKLKEIFNADNDYDIVEKEIFHFLENLL